MVSPYSAAIAVGLASAVTGLLIANAVPLPSAPSTSGWFWLAYPPSSGPGYAFNASKNLSWADSGVVRFSWGPDHLASSVSTLKVSCTANDTNLYSSDWGLGQGSFSAGAALVYEFSLSNAFHGMVLVQWNETPYPATEHYLDPNNVRTV
jgi:hypothetical protein